MHEVGAGSKSRLELSTCRDPHVPFRNFIAHKHLKRATALESSWR